MSTKAGWTGVAANAVALARAVQGDRLRQVPHPGLGRIVGGEVVAGDVRRDRRDIDDRAAAGCGNPPDRVLAAEEDAVEVQRVQGAPVLERGLLDRAVDGGAGAVHQHVQPAERADGRVQRDGPGFLLGDVLRDGDRGLADGVGDGLGPLEIDVRDRDLRALARKQQRRGAADPRRGACNQRDLAADPSQIADPSL